MFIKLKKILFFNLIYFVLFYFFYLGFVFAYEVKIVYFYEEDNYFVLYYPNSLKLFVDINSGYVIKPEVQEAKVSFVSYILDTKNFISRDEDVFTKLYLIKKAIGFNFNDLQPNNIDYYSWSNLTYKYLITFLKNIENSITISIPSWENLSEADKKDIIEKYRLVFGTSFNEPRYLPYEIIFKKDISKSVKTDNKISQNQIYQNEVYQNQVNNNLYNISNTTFISTTFTISTNANNNTLETNRTNNLKPSNNNNNNNFISFIYENKIIIFLILLLFLVLITLFLGFIFVKKYLFSSNKKYDHEGSNKDLKVINEYDSEYSSNYGSDKSLEKKIEEIIQDRLTNLEQKIMEKINLNISELKKRIEDLENSALSIHLNKDAKDFDFITNNESNKVQVIDNDLSKSKKLDPENLEIFMFKIDTIISKLKFLENYKDYNINDKATKIIFKLQELKSKVRASKAINMSFWEEIIKNDVIELISILDRYLLSIDYNPNISKIREELLNMFDLEEIEVIVNTTKVNIIEHKVEGYSRNSSVPNGVITELKEKGYKYRGIVLKRAKVIENKL
ncbi:MAG: hypothetical protein ACP5O4_01335 [bacterium]